ncbi:MAG: HlyD family efflux transporter periplasmic adaptor subunit [Cyanobacteria bacterium J06554_6]
MDQLKIPRFWPLRLRQPRSAPPAETEPKSHQHPRRLPRWLPYGLAGLGVTVLVALAFRPAPIPVDVGQVTEGPFQVTVDAEGKTRVEDRYVVAAPVAGRLQRIELEPGDPVTADRVVAQIDPLPLNTQVQAAQARLRSLQAELAGVETQRPKSEELAQAEAQLRSAQATQQAAVAEVAQVQAALVQARRDRDRAQDLEARGAISRQAREAAELEATRLARSLETAQRERDSATAAVAAAGEALPLLRAQQQDPDYLVDAYRAQIAGVEAELANLADEARRTTLTAPATGTVLRVPEASARFVQAGDPLIELGDPDQIELVIDVLSADAVKIEPNDKILIEQWGGGETLTGIVSTVEPAAFTEVSALGVEEQRVNIVGTFDNKNASLGDGFRVEAQIIIWDSDDALQVPISALYRCGGSWCVFVVKSGRAYPREITLSQRSPSAAVVETGLERGEQVILHPSDQIQEGRKVEPR